MRYFADEILINRKLDKLKDYIDEVHFIEHNPRMSDGISALRSVLSDPTPKDGITIKYDRVHRLLAEGSFVLSVSEGSIDGVPLLIL